MSWFLKPVNLQPQTVALAPWQLLRETQAKGGREADE